MKRNRIISLVCVITLLFSLTFTGIGNSAGEARDLLTIEVYDVAANYQGIQSGWFGQIIKEKFNIELNIIAPQVAGDAQMLYQTRTASGKLGDIILLDNADFQDCIKAGLVADITDEVKASPNLSQYYDQYTFYNAMLEGNEAGAIYGLPCQITNTSPTTYSETEVYVSPMLPWDYFTEIGAPQMKNLDDLLDVLQQIKTAHPVAENGEPIYPITLWPDWDSYYLEPIAQMSKWYGYEVRDSILLGYKGDMKEIVDEEGSYYKITKFMNQAYQRGLLDVDSATQKWDDVVGKMSSRQVLLLWYSWQRGFWNTPDRGNDRTNYIYAPVDDLQVYQPSDPFYGDGRVFGVGAHITGEAKDRIIEFLDWCGSPEGSIYMQHMIPGYSFTVGEDGKYIMTEDGLYAYMENRKVPDELGGGGFYDGKQEINQWILAGVSTNPETGESYTNALWSSYLEMNKTNTTKEWAAKYGADYQVPYLLSTGQLHVVPNVNIIMPSDGTDISLIRGQCGEAVKDSTWRAVYAKDDADFDRIWGDLKNKLNGLGWEELVAHDMQKYQTIVNARNAALGN